ncbi:MAG: response regulator transcription factor, partial [Deltaproteobacteria bacterium]|nr:response regulator transcription factor [Deltaproteobacteria bacterium]
MTSVLVVDDEPELRAMVRRYLEAEGFAVTEAVDGDAALAAIAGVEPDILVLDVSMPGRDGFEILQELRRTNNLPVIMLTARSEEIDRVIGLTVGADDYVTKPFSPRELVARIRAVLRRTQGGDSGVGDTMLVFDGLTISEAAREVRCAGVEIEISTLEFDLLVALARAPGRVFSRAQLLEQVWGWDYYGV